MDERENDLKYVIERYDKQIDIELTLINARMTWLVISQSFLIGSFVSAASAASREVGLAIQLVVAFVGFMACNWVRMGINAALSMVARWKNERQEPLAELSKSIGMPLAAVSSVERAHHDGNLAPAMIPRILMIAWVCFLGVWIYRMARL